nr:RNA-directed DNA polymerase, eukaryota [Tanacetum cinerariifolium]
MINRKRAKLAVKGVMIEGEWVDDPSKVKDEFRDYFASRFCDPGIRHGVINFNFPNRLNIDQSGELEAPISRDEIRRAVWDCGENKSPGPDGFTFKFFRRLWNIVGPDLCLAVECINKLVFPFPNGSRRALKHPLNDLVMMVTTKAKNRIQGSVLNEERREAIRQAQVPPISYFPRTLETKEHERRQ